MFKHYSSFFFLSDGFIGNLCLRQCNQHLKMNISFSLIRVVCPRHFSLLCNLSFSFRIHKLTNNYMCHDHCHGSLTIAHAQDRETQQRYFIAFSSVATLLVLGRRKHVASSLAEYAIAGEYSGGSQSLSHVLDRCHRR